MAIPEQRAAIGVALAFGVLAAAAVITATSGTPPYGQQALLEYNGREATELCSNFGFTAQSQRFADCVLGLAGFRQRHQEYLTARSW